MAMIPVHEIKGAGDSCCVIRMSIQIFIVILILLVNSWSLFNSRAHTFSFCRECGAVVCFA